MEDFLVPTARRLGAFVGAAAIMACLLPAGDQQHAAQPGKDEAQPSSTFNAFLKRTIGLPGAPANSFNELPMLASTPPRFHGTVSNTPEHLAAQLDYNISEPPVLNMGTSLLSLEMTQTDSYSDQGHPESTTPSLPRSCGEDNGN